MAIYQVVNIIDNQPTFKKPFDEILAELKKGGALQILDPIEYITDQQRKWYKGICLRDLARNDENQESTEWWDIEVKKQCGGLAYLKKEIFFFEDMAGSRFGVGRLTTKGVGKKNMTNFIEEILAKAVEKGWPVSAPNEELRKNPQRKRVNNNRRPCVKEDKGLA